MRRGVRVPGERKRRRVRASREGRGPVSGSLRVSSPERGAELYRAQLEGFWLKMVPLEQ